VAWVSYIILQGEEPDDGKHRLYRRGSRKASLRLLPIPSPSDKHQEAGLPDAAAVEAMLAIALLRLQNNEPHPSGERRTQSPLTGQSSI